MPVLLAGQFLTVGAQLMTVIVVVSYTVDVLSELPVVVIEGVIATELAEASALTPWFGRAELVRSRVGFVSIDIPLLSAGTYEITVGIAAEDCVAEAGADWAFRLLCSTTAVWLGLGAASPAI
jgi:hypothetical protein